MPALGRLSAPLLEMVDDALSEVDVELLAAGMGSAGSGMRGNEGEPLPLRAHRQEDEPPHVPLRVIEP